MKIERKWMARGLKGQAPRSMFYDDCRADGDGVE
jgi:hypothetical protein